MTVKDWIYLGITVASYFLAIIAGVYAKDKAKINRANRAGQVLDVLGKLATNAVHEAEYIGGSGQEKRDFASEIITQGLSWFGIKGVTSNAVNGAIEKAVNAMNIANQDVKPAEPEIAKNVPEKDILQPLDQLEADSEPEQQNTAKNGQTAESEQRKGVTANDK